jgi:hypothetical protein
MIKTSLSLLLLSLSLVSAQTVPATPAQNPPAAAHAPKEAAEKSQLSAFDAGLPQLIQCQFECIELTLEDMTNLLFLRDQSLADATALRKELQKMVAEKKAKLVDTTIIVAKDGLKATNESIMEYIYATEYEPSEVPSSVAIPEKKITPEDVKVLEWMRTPPTPTAFEPRNVGGNVEVEPKLTEGSKRVELRFAWEIVDHEGEKAWLKYNDTMNNTYKIAMPKFYVKRISTTISCAPSSYTLVATVDPQNEKGIRDPSRKWLVFVKCEVQTVR